MAVLYLDSSALSKLYIVEHGTDVMRRLFRVEAGHQFAVLSISRIEFRSAVWRRHRANMLEGVPPGQLLSELHSDWATRFQIWGVSGALLDIAAGVIDRHPLKASDAIQLSGCLVLRAASATTPTFVASDHQLLRAAAGEGLSIFNPAA